MVQEAEDNRRKKESEESGRRQAEMVVRHRADTLYQELKLIHQNSADSYLHTIISSTV